MFFIIHIYLFIFTEKGMENINQRSKKKIKLRLFENIWERNLDYSVNFTRKKK